MTNPSQTEKRATNTADQYVKAIYLVQQVEDGPASTGALAERLGVSPATANEMIGKLAERGLAEHEKYKGVELTDEGVARARRALSTYCIIERFLVDVLDVEEFQREARELESVIDDTVAARLDTIIDRESDCPDCFDAVLDHCERLEAGAPADD